MKIIIDEIHAKVKQKRAFRPLCEAVVTRVPLVSVNSFVLVCIFFDVNFVAGGIEDHRFPNAADLYGANFVAVRKICY